ncbi:MAG: cysteine hydrolase [Planctomycetota bacterium]|nr:cysteine hydrolase [Planctomycetota bacterium]
MHSKKAIILIDLQREFLSPIGLFKKNHIPAKPLLCNIKSLVEQVRTQPLPPLIIWVRSEYDHKARREIRRLRIPKDKLESSSPPNNDFLSSSHFGKRPCCPKESPRSGFHEDAQRLIGESDVVVTKHWYSSFTETNLLTVLRENAVHELWVGGLLSNVCVMATVCDAYFLGFKVVALEDCLAASSPERHQQAMTQIAEHYGEVRQNEEML